MEVDSPARSDTPRIHIRQGETIEGIIVDSDFDRPGRLVRGRVRETDGSAPQSSQLTATEIPEGELDPPTGTEWKFNTTIALVSNALTVLTVVGNKAKNAYFSKIFLELTTEIVRADVRSFLATVAEQKGQTSEEMWKTHFKNAQKPGLKALVEKVPELTAHNDFQKVQYSVRPTDMKLAFSGEQVLSVAMCAMMAEMSERLEAIEADRDRPTDTSLCLETVVQSAIAPLVEPITRASTKAATQPSKKKKVSNPAKATSSRPRSFSAIVGGSSGPRLRSTTVTGSTGAYVGPKTDKFLKIHVGESYGANEVKKAVQAATKTEEGAVTVENLSRSAKNYAMSYRVKVSAMRADIAAELLQRDLWPAGMSVSEWKGAWQPLVKHSQLKVFVGNLSKTASANEVADKIKSIYEKASIEITSVSVEQFVGKKENSSCQNLIVSLQATKPGISMEPIQAAKMAALIPPRVFDRRYRTHSNTKCKFDWV